MKMVCNADPSHVEEIGEDEEAVVTGMRERHVDGGACMKCPEGIMRCAHEKTSGIGCDDCGMTLD